jgi:hypothetical protein
MSNRLLITSNPNKTLCIVVVHFIFLKTQNLADFEDGCLLGCYRPDDGGSKDL